MSRLPRTLAVTLVALAACTGRAPEAGAPAPPTSSSPAAPARAAVPEPLRFTAPAVGGGTVRGADLAGRDVAVWLWAPW